jgi:hypothetical protein
MMATLLLIIFAVLALSVLLIAARGNAHAESFNDLMGQAKKVDLAAFRNLTDTEEEHYLRTHLDRSAFRTVQRQRMRAAVDYLWRTAHNAALLMRIGQAARQAADPATASAGTELANRALQLRIYSLLALAKLYLNMAFPGAQFSRSTVADRYEQMCASVLNLGRLVVPAQVSKVEACL